MVLLPTIHTAVRHLELLFVADQARFCPVLPAANAASRRPGAMVLVMTVTLAAKAAERLWDKRADVECAPVP